MALMIDVISDVVCPWCYIGKRHLESALATLSADDPAFEATVNWHPFELNPELPVHGIERRRYLEAKFGGPEGTRAVHGRIREAGASVGIAFDFERVAVQPNTLAAHRLISWAQRDHDAADLVERLFAAYFVEGRDVGDHAVLAAIAGEAGLDAVAARQWLDGDAARLDIAAMVERARALGVSGVPFFIFGNRLAVSGAQLSHVLADAIRQARTMSQEAG